MKKNIELGWENELEDINKINFPLFIYASAFGLLIYSVYDYFSIPSQWKVFLVLRIICSIIGILLVRLNRNQKISVRNAVIIFLSGVYLFFSYGASLQNTNNQLLTWNLSVIVAGLFWPFFIITVPKKINLILSLFFLTSYVVFYCLFSNFSIQNILIQGGAFFIFGILGSVIINFAKYNMQYKNFKLRHELSVSKNELEMTNNDLNEANKVKNKLFSIIAHDLRTPFNSLIGFSDLLLNRVSLTSDAEIQMYASIINDGLTKTYNYLINLLEWSRMQSNVIKYQPVGINVNNLVDEVKELLIVQAQNKYVNIKYTPEHKIEVFADMNMMKIVLINLVSNAIKFSHHGADILISCKRNDTQVKMSIQDNGIGMSKETVEKLFRVDESFSTPGTNNEKGTGLGLVLSNEFIKKHGGTIDVKSEIGKGSVFYICLPINGEKE